MALNAAIEWDVRTTGNDGNGGGFKAGASGTDYSLQDAAQKSGADLTMHAADNTKCHPAAAGVSALDVGNVVYISAGTGWTPGRYEITSQDGTDWTLDRSPSAAGNANLGTYNMGGALASPRTAISAAVTGNTVHIQAGTYTWTTTYNVALSGRDSLNVIGYQTTHGDEGTRPLITSSTNSVDLFAMGTDWAATFGTWVVRNIEFSHTAGIRGYGFRGYGAGATTLSLVGCKFTGLRFAAASAAGEGNFAQILVANSEITGGTGGAVLNAGGVLIQGSYIHDNAVDNYLTYGAVGTSGNDQGITVRRSVIADTSNGSGIHTVSRAQIHVTESTIAGNNTYGVRLEGGSRYGGVVLVNNIIYGNGSYGVSVAVGSPHPQINHNNAYGANSSGPRENIPVGTNDVNLSADPFTDAANGDYSLNDAAGGGAACKAAGFQWGA